MKGLMWVRLDTSIASHDKTLRLFRMGNRGVHAYAVYTFALGYCGAHATDGFVPDYALTMIHGTAKDAEALVEVGMFDEVEGGWEIRNYAERQELAATTRRKREGSAKGACAKWMKEGRPCRCGYH